MNSTRSIISFICFFILLGAFTACKESPSSKKAEDTAKKAEEAGKTDSSDEDEAQSLDPADFEKQMRKSGAVLLDLSFPEDFAQGHIDGAINVNFFDQNFQGTLMSMDKTKTYLLYTNNESRVRRTGIFMRGGGFKQVYTLKGGWEAWKEYKKK